MKFCSNCGRAVVFKVPPGDNLPRYSCDACAVVYYQNPKVVVGCIPEWEDKILLCKRAIEPRYGLWTLPAGFMENGETTMAGAARETLEEACARVEIDTLCALYNLPHINQIYMLFRARLLDLDFCAGAESLEVRLYSEAEIPWDEIAFAAVRKTLLHYFDDRRTGNCRLHIGTIEKPGGVANETVQVVSPVLSPNTPPRHLMSPLLNEKGK